MHGRSGSSRNTCANKRVVRCSQGDLHSDCKLRHSELIISQHSNHSIAARMYRNVDSKTISPGTNTWIRLQLVCHWSQKESIWIRNTSHIMFTHTQTLDSHDDIDSIAAGMSLVAKRSSLTRNTSHIMFTHTQTLDSHDDIDSIAAGMSLVAKRSSLTRNTSHIMFTTHKHLIRTMILIRLQRVCHWSRKEAIPTRNTSHIMFTHTQTLDSHDDIDSIAARMSLVAKRSHSDSKHVSHHVHAHTNT
jgi:hypothetical protein